MFTATEAEFCVNLFAEMVKKEREKLGDNHADHSTDENAELMRLVAIHNKFNSFFEKQNQSISQTVTPKVLIVDDVDAVQDIVDDILYEMGFQKVVAVHSAEKALSALLEAAEAGTPFKIVLTDDEMSGKSGLELLKDIRVNEQLADTDVFIMSANSSQEQIVAAMQAGVTGYILKPLNFNILQQKLGDYLPSKTPNEQTKNVTNSDKADETVVGKAIAEDSAMATDKPNVAENVKAEEKADPTPATKAPVAEPTAKAAAPETKTATPE